MYRLHRPVVMPVDSPTGKTAPCWCRDGIWRVERIPGEARAPPTRASWTTARQPDTGLVNAHTIELQVLAGQIPLPQDGFTAGCGILPRRLSPALKITAAFRGQRQPF
jgi:hypothetical protein